MSTPRKNIPSPPLCQYCGLELNEETLCVDYITPLSRGGTRERSNRAFCCPICSREKEGRTVEEYRVHLRKTWISDLEILAGYLKLKLDVRPRSARENAKEWKRIFAAFRVLAAAINTWGSDFLLDERLSHPFERSPLPHPNTEAPSTPTPQEVTP